MQAIVLDDPCFDDSGDSLVMKQKVHYELRGLVEAGKRDRRNGGYDQNVFVLLTSMQTNLPTGFNRIFMFEF